MIADRVGRGPIRFAVVLASLGVLGLLVGCSGGDSPGDTQVPGAQVLATPTPTPATSSTPPPAEPRGTYRTTFEPGITRNERVVATSFLQFARSPTPPSRAALEIAPGPLVLRLGATEKRLTVRELANAEAWMLSDAEGVATTSALFVVSNRVRNAAKEGDRPAEFRVLRSATDCDLLESPVVSGATSVHVYPATARQVDCTQGFRIDLALDSEDRVRAVGLAVRVP